MGLFTPIAGLLAALHPPAPTYQPVAFQSVGDALLGIGAADPAAGGVALRIARAFTATVCDRLGLTETGVWNALVTAPGDWVALLWDGTLWDTLSYNLIGDLGISVRPTLH